MGSSHKYKAFMEKEKEEKNNIIYVDFKKGKRSSSIDDDNVGIDIESPGLSWKDFVKGFASKALGLLNKTVKLKTESSIIPSRDWNWKSLTGPTKDPKKIHEMRLKLMYLADLVELSGGIFSFPKGWKLEDHVISTSKDNGDDIA